MNILQLTFWDAMRPKRGTDRFSDAESPKVRCLNSWTPPLSIRYWLPYCLWNIHFCVIQRNPLVVRCVCFLRIRVYLVVYDSGEVPLEYLLLSRYPHANYWTHLGPTSRGKAILRSDGSLVGQLHRPRLWGKAILVPPLTAEIMILLLLLLDYSHA